MLLYMLASGFDNYNVLSIPVGNRSLRSRLGLMLFQTAAGEKFEFIAADERR
jgi:hypothetical protein